MGLEQVIEKLSDNGYDLYYRTSGSGEPKYEINLQDKALVDFYVFEGITKLKVTRIATTDLSWVLEELHKINNILNK